MNSTLLGTLTLVILGLLIAGITFITWSCQSVYSLGGETARTPALVGGITCLILSVGLLVFAIIMSSRKNP